MQSTLVMTGTESLPTIPSMGRRTVGRSRGRSVSRRRRPTLLLARLLVLLSSLLQLLLIRESSSWVIRSPMITPTNKSRIVSSATRPNRRPRTSLSSSLVMRDRSCAYWFQVGDAVRVVTTGVEKDGVDLRGRVGRVVETWEKCDVDPTCCCAEQVDPDMAVRVEFFPGTLLPNDDDNGPTAASSFRHYFAESELEKVVDDKPVTESVVPFDGQSCVAFKLDRLKMGQQAQRLAAFEESRAAGNEENLAANE